ncbi:lysosomal thioesterase PPT2-A-like [Haliotis cracherodii]|uniref:lysosomal thioesterase PPT2-A-like n=1 Tax=Haliotis cracherodii TaxID=6455 RepID=UPI0039ED196C
MKGLSDIMQTVSMMKWVVLVSVLTMASGYKHVVFMHGILAGPSEFDKFAQQIKIDHPGTNTTQINAFVDAYSLEPMWNQVEKIQIIFTQIMADNPDGIHLVCFSQGGLVCRGLMSLLQHNVDTFIGLSCPLAGQYGDTAYLKYLFPNYVKSNIYRYFYTDNGQKWSVANYWYDPHHQDEYHKFSTYLAILNNDTHNGQSQTFKENFSRLKKMVLVGGPDDGVITPWQSSHFGMYNGSEVVLPMQEQRWYKEDSFGLRTLYERKAITTFTYSGVQHIHWHSDMDVYKKSVEPFLT